MLLPDEHDRHVLAAALAAEATVLCTFPAKDFPAEVLEPFGVEVLTPDELLSRLVAEYEPQMFSARRMPVSSFEGASDASTIAALRIPSVAVAWAHHSGRDGIMVSCPEERSLPAARVGLGDGLWSSPTCRGSMGRQAASWSYRIGCSGSPTAE